MRISFVVYIIIFLSSSNAFTQETLFSNDSWENTVSQSKEKNRVILIYVYDDSTNCKLCKDIEQNIFQNAGLIERLSSKIRIYKAAISQSSQEMQLFKKWGLRQTPTLFFVSYNMDRLFKVEPITSDFDLEGMYNSIIQEFEQSQENRNILNRYHEEKGNAEVIKDYIKLWKSQHPTIVLEKPLLEYLNAISTEEQLSDETLKLMLDCVYYADEKMINIHFRQLEKAVREGKIFNQFIIKERILSSVIGKISQGTVESKIYIKKGVSMAEKCNKISPYFTNFSNEIFDVYYHASARTTDKFMKKSKAYYAKNALKFDKKTLAIKDSLFNIELQKAIINDTTLSKEEIKIISERKNYFSNAYSANLSFIAKTIYFQQKYLNRLDFGIKCAKKALELAPNASRMVIYGLVCAKNEHFKIAYDVLLEAIELESQNRDTIDRDLAQPAYMEFLKIQKMIPNDY